MADQKSIPMPLVICEMASSEPSSLALIRIFRGLCKAAADAAENDLKHQEVGTSDLPRVVQFLARFTFLDLAGLQEDVTRSNSCPIRRRRRLRSGILRSAFSYQKALRPCASLRRL